MVLTKEDLQQIKLPLSEKTYINLHETEVSLGDSLYGLVPRDVLDALELMEVKYFDQAFPGNNVPIMDIGWAPPQTKEYEDYPRIERPREEALAAFEAWHKAHPNS